MSISDQISALEAKSARDDAEIRALREQIERQKGGILEGRAQNAQLLKEVVESRELIGTYQTHFHAFHGSADHIKQQEKALAAAAPPEPKPEPASAPVTLKSRLKRLAKNGPEAA